MENKHWHKKDKIMFGVAVASFCLGGALAIFGAIVAPMGMIDGSILGFGGECFGLTGAIFGIGTYGNHWVRRMKDIHKEQDEDED